MNPNPLQPAYEALHAEAAALAGQPGDIPERVRELYKVYEDSRGNHTFPLIALHGALWAYDFFETSGKLGKVIQWRYFYNRKERDYRMGLLNRFAEGFKIANRQVFMDTWANYHFTKAHGEDPNAAGIIEPELLAALNRVHAANRAGHALSRAEKRAVFETALAFEQETAVAPRIKLETDRFDCPILTFCCLRPVVRFAYFPGWKRFFFRDFSDKAERIRRAMASFDLAAQVGWKVVVDAMQRYETQLQLSL